MPYDRGQTDIAARTTPSGLEPVQYRVTADPVDTYVRGDPAAVKLEQLAQGLSAIAPHLAQFSDTLFAHQAESDQIQGREAARQWIEQHKSYQDAIKAGLIDKHASPYFRAGAEEQFGRVLGGKYTADLSLAFAASGMHDSTDPKAFDTFESQYRDKWVSQHLGDGQRSNLFTDSFGHAVDSGVGEQRGAFVQHAGEILAATSEEAVHQEAYDSALKHFGAGESPEAIANDWMAQAKTAIAQGHDAGMVNRKIAQAAYDAAMTAGNTDAAHASQIMSALDHFSTGSGSLGSTSYGSELKNKLTGDMARKSREDSEFQQTQQKKAWMEAADTQLATTFHALASNPYADISKQMDAISKIPLFGVEYAEKLAAAREDIVRSQNLDDEPLKDEVMLRLYSGAAGPSDVLAMAQRRHLPAATLHELMGSALEIQRGKMEGALVKAQLQGAETQEAQFAVKDPAAEAAMSGFAKSFSKDGGDPSGIAALKASTGHTLFTKEYWDWYSKGGKDQPFDKRLEMAQKIKDSVLMRVDPLTFQEAVGGKDKLPMIAKDDPFAAKDWTSKQVISGHEYGALYNLLHGRKSADASAILHRLDFKGTPKDLNDLLAAQYHYIHKTR